MALWLHDPAIFLQSDEDLKAYAAFKASGGSFSVLADREISVEEAYERAPHRRTVFDSDRAKMTAEEARYLEALFRLTDEGVIERIYLQTDLYYGDGSAFEEANYEVLKQALAGLRTPERLLGVEALIYEALDEQQRYFRAWSEAGDPRFFSTRADLVRSSHNKLIAAYKTLLRLYGNEGKHNRQAFFDHLCALDFI